MQQFTVIVDFNGIVLFEPTLLKKYYNGIIEYGTNLYHRFITMDEGDEVVNLGMVIPILGINDGVYRIVIRRNEEPSTIEDGVFFENSVFPLHVAQRLVIADLAVLLEWEDDLGWQNVDLSAGFYSIAVRGFRFIERNIVVDCGYEFVVKPEHKLPLRTGDLEKNMQVLCLP